MPEATNHPRCVAITVTTKKRCRIPAPHGWDEGRDGEFMCGVHDKSGAAKRRSDLVLGALSWTNISAKHAIGPDPACWSWPEPDRTDPEWWMPDHLRPGYAPPPGEPRLGEEAVATIRRLYEVPDEIGAAMVDRWQQGRCAVCAWGKDRLVMDHDHVTGLIRGRLCSSCNTREGLNRGPHCGVWQAYRERNPAVILGVRARYYNSYTGEYANPAPAVDYDPVRDSPLRGIGL